MVPKKLKQFLRKFGFVEGVLGEVRWEMVLFFFFFQRECIKKCVLLEENVLGLYL